MSVPDPSSWLVQARPGQDDHGVTGPLAATEIRFILSRKSLPVKKLSFTNFPRDTQIGNQCGLTLAFGAEQTSSCGTTNTNRHLLPNIICTATQRTKRKNSQNPYFYKRTRLVLSMYSKKPSVLLSKMTETSTTTRSQLGTEFREPRGE